MVKRTNVISVAMAFIYIHSLILGIGNLFVVMRKTTELEFPHSVPSSVVAESSSLKYNGRVHPSKWLQLDDQDDTSRPSIKLGDLPGYTGWSRPARTEAPFYRVESITHNPTVHQELNIRVICSSKKRRKCKGSLYAAFYVRMYGPTILTGTVHALGRGRYDITFIPRDAGKYWIEVVLTYSNADDFGHYPLPMDKREAPYEGYLLHGFPLPVYVAPDAIMGSVPFEDRVCDAEDLLVRSHDDGLYMASWRVIDRVNSLQHVKPNMTKAITLSGYQEGHNSLGILAEYQPANCNLIGLRENLTTSFDERMLERGKPLHIVYIGDSVMRLQKDLFDEIVCSRSIRTTRIITNNGIIPNFHNISLSLASLDAENEELVIFFNSGLHDISHLCSRKKKTFREKYMPEDFKCWVEYQNAFAKLVNVIRSVPAKIKVFQSTSAAWMRWGNYGFRWPPDKIQPMPLSTHFVEHFNHIAFRILDHYPEIDIVDGYWITLARPDNREINDEMLIGSHMVHPGKEVVSAMTRTWANVLLASLAHSREASMCNGTNCLKTSE